MIDPNLLPFAERVLGLLLVMTAVLGLLAGAECLVTLWRARRSRYIRRAPDDPRLRNVVALRDWRAKRAAVKRRWVA